MFAEPGWWIFALLFVDGLVFAAYHYGKHVGRSEARRDDARLEHARAREP